MAAVAAFSVTHDSQNPENLFIPGSKALFVSSRKKKESAACGYFDYQRKEKLERFNNYF